MERSGITLLRYLRLIQVINETEFKQLVLNPKANPEEFCKVILHDLLLAKSEENDFARWLTMNWKRIYNISNFVLQKDELKSKTVQLIDDKYRDITIDVNISRYGNVNIYIVSLNGYCCRRKQKDVSLHIEF